jgi:hypothetical protein
VCVSSFRGELPLSHELQSVLVLRLNGCNTQHGLTIEREQIILVKVRGTYKARVLCRLWY